MGSNPGNVQVRFNRKALKEWGNLPADVKERFRKKLKERIETGHPESARLRGRSNIYKIKCKRPSYRLVYAVDENGDIQITVIVVAPRDQVYAE